MQTYNNLIIKELNLSEYEDIHSLMKEFTTNRTNDTSDEIWFLEHPPVFTLGLAAKSEHILQKTHIPIIQTDRGGQVTYHGPGQLICYFLIDLKRKKFGVKEFVYKIEQAVIDFLTSLKIKAHRIENAPGIYVNNKKICSMGLKIKKSCSYHGISFNVDMDLTPFNYINPCGYKNLQLTQLKDFNINLSLTEVNTLLMPFLAKNLGYKEQQYKEQPQEQTKEQQSNEIIINKTKVKSNTNVNNFSTTNKINASIKTNIIITSNKNTKLTKPDWLKIKASNSTNVNDVKTLLKQHNLCTVCEKAACPNLNECFSKKTATFMIMGSKCTRTCAFCNVVNGNPAPLDPNEPINIATVIDKMKLKYVVITSVTRDDLDDGGANHFAECIKKIKQLSTNIKVEILVPDFKRKIDIAFNKLSKHLPDVFNHNLETVPRLYTTMRKGASYKGSLDLLDKFYNSFKGIPTKSGLMLGLGETNDEIKDVIVDLYKHNVSLLTLGQYLQPSKDHAPVRRYIHPEEFNELANFAKDLGFKNVASGPFVRSSYQAEQQYIPEKL